MANANLYAAAAIDRAAHLRGDSTWIEARRHHPETRILPVWRNRNLIIKGDLPLAGRLSPQEFTAPDAQNAPAIVAFLGLFKDVPHFAIDVSHLDDPAPLAEKAGGHFDDLRNFGPLLAHDDAGLLAYARGLLYWHRHHGHCAACGTPTDIDEAGHMRRCPAKACQAEHFPRTDPAIITLVTTATACLLGRQQSWPKGMYSTLAGFVEPGESLEDTVAREVLEETGVRVTESHYQSSQPWPFPASLMLGFRAVAAPGQKVSPMVDELEDVRWFSREELKNRKQTGLRLPYHGAISRTLIEAWIEEG